MAANIFGTVSSAEPSRLNASFGGSDLVLKMGSKIIPKHHSGAYLFGVVGPFVKGPSSLFFVTANHVVTHIGMSGQEVTKPQIVQLFYKGGGEYGSRTCGTVICGGKGKSPAALIEITQEQFVKTEYSMRNGEFQFEGISAINFPTYDNRDLANKTSVYVFGNELRTATAKIIVDNTRGIIVLTTDENCFTKREEGGAAIFIVDQFNILHCVGIFVCQSKFDTRTIVVRPIQKILHKLGKEIGQQLEIASFDKKTHSSTTSLDRNRYKMDKDTARFWFETPELPDPEILNMLTKMFGRKSEIVWKNCLKICSSIKKENNKIIKVIPTYKEEDSSKIVFVVFLRDEIHIKKHIGYTLVMKYLDIEKHNFGEEGKFVMSNKLYDEANLSNDENIRLRNCINRHADKLMNEHKFLTIINGSPLRSKKFGSSSPKLEIESCLVLYVLCKGYIPIDEEPFKRVYDDVTVDVREGKFFPYSNTADSYHADLKMGCQIGRQKAGTVGGFLEYPGYGLCGLTCAHVLLDSSEMRALTSESHGTKEWQYPSSDEYIYQPEKNFVSASIPGSDNFVGRLVKAVYRKGDGGQSGMDIALFQVERRYPVSGEFPNLRDGRKSEMSFDSGRSVGFSRLKFGRVTKFGATSDKTDGTVIMQAPLLSVKYYRSLEHLSDFKLILHNLLEVKTLTVSAHGEIKPFADFGDSGALVFCEGHDSELICVGIVEGGISTDTCAVMPIMPVLDELNVTGFKSFANENLKREVNALRQEVELFKGKEKKMKDSFNQNFQECNKKVHEIEQKVDLLTRR